MVREDFVRVASYSVYGVAATAVKDICGSLETGGSTIVYTSYGLPQHKELDIFPHCGLAVQLHLFLASTLVGGESSTLRPGRLNPGKGDSYTLNEHLGRLQGPPVIEAGFLNIRSHSLVTVVTVFVFVYHSLRPDILRE